MTESLFLLNKYSLFIGQINNDQLHFINVCDIYEIIFIRHACRYINKSTWDYYINLILNKI